MDIPDISKLHKEKELKNIAKKNIFNIVLEKCIEKIIYTNKYLDQTFIYFEIPFIIAGCPSYDRLECIVYIMNELIKKDYRVDFIPNNNSILIDWGTNIKNSKKIDNINFNGLSMNSQKLKEQTKELLKQYPNTSKIQFVYQDSNEQNKKDQAKKLKKKK